MVLVPAPESSAPDTESTGQQDVAPAAVNNVMAAAVPAASIDTTPATDETPLDDNATPSDSNATPPEAPVSPEQHAAALESPSDEAPVAAAGPLLPTDQWTSAASQAWKVWLANGVAACMGMVLAVGVFGFVVTRGASVAKTRVDSPPAEVTADDNSEEVGTTNTTSPGIEPTVTPAAPAAAPEVVESHEEPVEEDEQELPVATVDVGSSEPETTRDDNPPGFEPEVPELASIDDPSPYTGPLPDQRDVPEFVLLSLVKDVDVIPLADRPEPREIDVAARLQDPIPSIQFNDVPLVDVVHFLTQFSTVPITFDLSSLQLSRTSPAARVSFQATDTTVGKLLTEVLQPRQLTYQQRDGYVIVTRRAADSFRSLTHDVGDMLASDSDAQFVKTLLLDGVDPESWLSRGGQGGIVVEGQKMAVHQTESNQLSVLLLLERLRLARGLPRQKPFSDPYLYSQPRFQLADAKLAQPVTLNAARENSLLSVLGRIGQQAGLHIVVDWRSLRGERWAPDSPTSLAVAELPARETLDQLLLPMGLTYRVFDATTIEVMAISALPPEVEMYSTAVEIDELRARFGHSLHYDEVSDQVVAALPQPLQRQLAEYLGN